MSCEVRETVTWSRCVCGSYFREVRVSEASTELFWFFFSVGLKRNHLPAVLQGAFLWYFQGSLLYLISLIFLVFESYPNYGADFTAGFILSL